MKVSLLIIYMAALPGGQTQGTPPNEEWRYTGTHAMRECKNIKTALTAAWAGKLHLIKFKCINRRANSPGARTSFGG